MPISDELEALRRGGLVKHKSTRLSAEVSKHGFVLTDPEHIAERRKQNSLNDKQSRLDAQKAWNSGGRGAAALNDLNLLYKKLITEQKAKRREAEKNLREWKKQQYVGKGGNVGAIDGVEFALPPPMPEEDEEVSMNNEALEMLPEHVVAALKEKYATDDAAAALSQALKEESDHDDGKGTLAQLMELPSSPVNLPLDEKDETPDELPPVAEEKKEPEPDEEEEPLVEEKEPAVEEKKEPVVEEEAETVVEEKIDPVVEEKTGPVIEEKEVEKVEDKKEPDEEVKIEPDVEEKAEEEAVEEIVKEKVEEIVEEKVEEKEEVAEVQEELEQLPIKEEPAPAPTRKEKNPSTINPISQTKRFYNTHAQEFIDNISPRLALTPTTHRSTFLTHIHTQQQTSNDTSSTVIDLGCGFGRDALHFTSLGNHVLGIDFSTEMLNHAKKLAPKAHFLNIDFRALGNVLVEQSVDGVWANASLVHLPKGEILDVLKGLYAATKVGGVLYLSLRIGSFDQTGVENREVFDVDERYIATESDEDNNEDDCDSRRKLYSYYTKEEVKELLTDSGWEVLEMGEDDRRGVSEYVTHSMMFAFATRRTI